MQIIKNGQITADETKHLTDDEPPLATRYTVSFARWKAEKASLPATEGLVGVRLEGGNPLEEIADDLPRLDLVVLEFSSMVDGRAFSQARLLRQRFGYTGEIRARGNFIRDQIYFLKRVGVNAFEPGRETDLEKLLPALGDFTANYQPAADLAETIRSKRG